MPTQLGEPMEPWRLFMEEKPSKILLLLERAEEPLYPLVIAREVESTYAHTLNTLARMKRLRLVRFETAGRVKLVRLTELGAEAAKTIRNLLDLLTLADLERKLERFYEQRVRGKELSKQKIGSVKRRLTRYRLELKRWDGGPEQVQAQVKRLRRRLREIGREVRGQLKLT